MTRALVLVMLIGCAGSEERGTLDAVPRAAAAALQKQSGGAAGKPARELEGGVEMWEATWVANGRKHEAKVTADGVMVEHEVEVPEAEVPAAVRATAERVVGKGAQYVQHMNGHYEAELVVGGKEKEAMIAPDGTLVGGDDDEDGDDD